MTLPNLSNPQTGQINALNFDDAIALALRQLRHSVAQLGTDFPGDTTKGDFYFPRRVAGFPDGVNYGWTTGLWTGLLWLAYELGGDVKFHDIAEEHVDSFDDRLQKQINLDHHDLGFLYFPSCVASYRINGSVQAKRIAIQAADFLMERYLPKAGIIQAWGDLSDPQQCGRIIIDCLMNLPLLHWASDVTGIAHYRDVAIEHALRSRDYLIRADNSSYHTFHFDPDTGKPLRGSTAQGSSDESSWARGQAWGIYGFALNHRYAPGLGLQEAAMKQADYFLRHLPEHDIAYWDLTFGDGSGEPVDSSASAIAVCGLLELAQSLPSGERQTFYRKTAERILKNLINRCAASLPSSNALLLHGVYSKPHGEGIDEGNLWGDFFYLEALSRMNGSLKSYW